MYTREKVIAYLCKGYTLEWQAPIAGQRSARAYLMRPNGDLQASVTLPMISIFFDAKILDKGINRGFEIYAYRMREGLNEATAAHAIEQLRARLGGTFSSYLI